MVKKIGILCEYWFPEGMAPTIRILSYCKGLVQNGVSVEIHSFNHHQKGVENEPSEGTINGIKYKIAYKPHFEHNRYRRFFIDKPYRRWKVIDNIRRSHQQEPFDFVLLSFDWLPFYDIYVPKLKKLGIKILFIGDEFPEPIRRLKSEVPKKDLDHYKRIYREIDGRVLMTKALQTFYDEKVCPKPTYILCSILDTERFNGISRETVERPYLCYMGNLMLAKDNVDNIIKAFALIADEFPELDLYLFGIPNTTDREIIEACITECKLSGRVYLKGRINYNQVPQTLANATVLVTSQPVTKRAAGGFPTKLAEYMMSHTPSIVTNVGEIHEYVSDGDTVFMVEPCDPVQYAAKMRYILNNPEVSKEVADRAYSYAVNNFGAKEITEGLVLFLNELKESL